MTRFLIAFLVLFTYADGFCFHAAGGIGEYDKKCYPDDSIRKTLYRNTRKHKNNKDKYFKLNGW